MIKKLNEFNENDTTESIVSKHVTSGLIDILDSIIDDMPYSNLDSSEMWSTELGKSIKDNLIKDMCYFIDKNL